MSQFNKNLKTAFRRTINAFGYDMHKLPPQPRKTSEIVELFIAGKTIKIHGGNSLVQVYQQNPNYNCRLADAVHSIQKKYPSAWVVDVGANVGDTLAFIRSQASVPVICVEGDSHCYELLEKNARQFDAIHLFNCFLAEHPGDAFVEADKEGWNMTLTTARPGAAGRKIIFETLDRLAHQLACQSLVKFIKVDTEGYDMRILKGASQLLDTAQPVLTFELNRDNIVSLGDDFASFLDYLKKTGYRHFFLTDPFGNAVCTLTDQESAPFLSLYQNSGYGHAIHYFDVWAFQDHDTDILEKLVAGPK